LLLAESAEEEEAAAAADAGVSFAPPTAEDADDGGNENFIAVGALPRSLLSLPPLSPSWA
jgi:hypothetical protein